MDFRPHWAQRLHVRGHRADYGHHLWPLVAELVGDLFIYSTLGVRGLRIVNLRTGHHWTALTPDRADMIGKIACSEDIVAFRTRRHAYVYTLSGDKRKQLALPNTSGPNVMTCNGRNLALVNYNIIDYHSWSAYVSVWNIDRAEGRSFQLHSTAIPRHSSRHNPPGLSEWQVETRMIGLPDTSFDTVTLFYLERAIISGTDNDAGPFPSPLNPDDEHSLRICFIRCRISDGTISDLGYHLFTGCLCTALYEIRHSGVPGCHTLRLRNLVENKPFESVLFWNNEAFRVEENPSPYTWHSTFSGDSDRWLYQSLFGQPLGHINWPAPSGRSARIGPPHNRLITSIWANETWLLWQYTHSWFRADRHSCKDYNHTTTKMGILCFEKGLRLAPEARAFLEDPE